MALSIKYHSTVPDKHVQEVDERELDEGREYGHEAYDYEHVQRRSVAHLQCKSPFTSVYDCAFFELLLQMFWAKLSVIK